MSELVEVDAWSFAEGWHKIQVEDREYRGSFSQLVIGGKRTLQRAHLFNHEYGSFEIYIAYSGIGDGKDHFIKGGYNVLLQLNDGVGATHVWMPWVAPDLLEFMHRFSDVLKIDNAIHDKLDREEKALR